MKNLLVHLNPKKAFNKEHSLMAKIQIDNSLRLGWKPEDMLLFTNFPYEYQGIKVIIVPDGWYCDFRPLSTKTMVVANLLKNHILKDDIYWVHDFDAYQNSRFDFKMNKDVALSTYGYSPKWSLGSYFFTTKAQSFFVNLSQVICGLRTEDERALVSIVKDNPDIIKEIQKLNITYNFGMRRVEENWKIADKPLKVVHFHLWGKDLPTLDIFLRGKNKLGFPLVSDELIELFKKHGII